MEVLIIQQLNKINCITPQSLFIEKKYKNILQNNIKTKHQMNSQNMKNDLASQDQIPQTEQIQDQFKQIQSHILQQYKKAYNIDPSINFLDIQFVPFEVIPKFLNKSNEKQIFNKFFSITQCPLYQMFTIIIFEYLYDLDVSRERKNLNRQVISNLKSLIYSQDFLKENFYVKRLVVEGFRYMDQISQHKSKKISQKAERGYDYCKKKTKSLNQDKIFKDSVQKDKQNHDKSDQISSNYSSSQFSNTIICETYFSKPITQILIEKDLIKGFVECWRQIVDRICINYQLQLLRQQDQLEIMELLSSFFELQFAFSLYKGKQQKKTKDKRINSGVVQQIIPCFQSTTHISIVFNQELSFQKVSQSDQSQSIQKSESSNNDQRWNWKTFVFFSNKSNPPPSQKTSKFLATLKVNKQKLAVKKCGTIKQDQKEDMLSLHPQSQASCNRRQASNSHLHSTPSQKSIIDIKLKCFQTNQYERSFQEQDEYDEDEDLKVILNKNLQKTTARKREKCSQSLQEILRNSRNVMQKGDQLVKRFQILCSEFSL